MLPCCGFRVGACQQREQQQPENGGTVQLFASYVQQMVDGFVQSRAGGKGGRTLRKLSGQAEK